MLAEFSHRSRRADAAEGVCGVYGCLDPTGRRARPHGKSSDVTSRLEPLVLLDEIERQNAAKGYDQWEEKRLRHHIHDFLLDACLLTRTLRVLGADL